MFGCKTPWALNNEHNWNRTQRMGGIVFVVMGAAFDCNFTAGHHFGRCRHHDPAAGRRLWRLRLDLPLLLPRLHRQNEVSSAPPGAHSLSCIAPNIQKKARSSTTILLYYLFFIHYKMLPSPCSSLMHRAGSVYFLFLGFLSSTFRFHADALALGFFQLFVAGIAFGAHGLNATGKVPMQAVAAVQQSAGTTGRGPGRWLRYNNRCCRA